MNIFDPHISGSLSVSGSGEISGDLRVLGTISGSIKGDGSQIFNIPSSGVTGLNLTRIADGSATASISGANGLVINTNTEITGVLKLNKVELGGNNIVDMTLTDGGGKYYINGVKTPRLSFIKGFKYRFYYNNNNTHPLLFSLTSDGEHNGGTIYTTGVTTNADPFYIQVEVTDATATTLYYWCDHHVGMGNAISVYSDFLQGQSSIGLINVDTTALATTGSNNFTNTQRISGSLVVTGSVDITGSMTLNGQPIGTGKLDETSFNSYTSSNDGRVSNLETSTGSLNTFTGSIDTTIKNKLNIDGVISGSIQVLLTGTTGYSTFSSSVSQSVSQTLLDSKTYTDNQTQQITSNLNSFTSSTNNRLSPLEISTASVNTFTSSISINVGALEFESASIKTAFNTYTSSNDSTNSTQTGRLNSLESASSSIRSNFNTYTSSNDTTNSTQNSKLSALETTTGSLNVFTSSATAKLTSIESATSSINTFTSSAGSKLTSLESESSSIRNNFNSYTSSNDSTNTTQNNRLGTIESTTGSLNTFTSSAINKLSSLENASASIRDDFNIYTASNNITNSTQNNTLVSLESASSSIRSDFNSYTSSNDSTNSTQNNRLGSLESTTGSLNSYTSSTNVKLGLLETSTSSLNTFTSSINATIKTKLNTEGVISSSVQINISGTTDYNTFSSSIATTDLNQNNRLDLIENKTGSYATTGSNIFHGDQTITGSLYVSQNLIIAGSSSIQNISSSVLNIADNIITVNAQNPSVRFGGLAVIDSGSSPTVSGSLLFDSTENQWVFVHQDQGTITSSMLLMGPETYNNLGNEIHLTNNRLLKSVNDEHLGDSNITDNGTKVSINSNTEVTGTLKVTGVIGSPTITAIETSTSSLNAFTSSLLTAIELTGSNLTVKGDFLVKGTTTNVNTSTLDVDNNLINLNGSGATFAGLRVKDTTAPSQISGSLLWDSTNDYWVAGQLGSEQKIITQTELNTQITRIGNLETSTGSLNSFTGSINTTIKSKLNADGVISGSSQINHNTTTNYDANQHIDHTTVSISAGNGLSGGGTIAATRTISLDTASATFTSGVKSKMSSDGVISGSVQIISSLPSGTVSGSSQILNGSGIWSGSAQLPSGIVSSSAQTIANLPLGTVSGSSQILNGSGIWSGSAQLPSGVVSGSAQVIASLPSGTISGSAQVIASLPSGTISGSAQLTSAFVQKIGDSMSGQLTISSTGTAGAATLKVNTSSAISFIHSQENFSPNMTAGQTNILVVGSAGSTKNAGYLGYNWTSSASNSNYVSLGHWGADNLLRVYGDGTVYMGTVTTGVWNGSAIPVAYGGTAATTAADARTNLGLVIGTDVLAQRSFGTAANNNTGDFATSAQGTTADNALPKGGGTMTGNISFTNTTSLGTQDVGGTAWFRPRDTSNNLHIRTSSGSIYLDTDGTFYFRTVGGASRAFIDSTNGGGRLMDTTTYSYAGNMNQNVRTTDSPTFSAITIGKSGTDSTITFPAQTNDPGYIKHYESANTAIMYFNVSDDTTDEFHFGYTGDASTFRLRADGVVLEGTWQGTAIGDSYISSATNWNTAYSKRVSSLGFTTSTVTITLGDATTVTASVPTFNQNTSGSAYSATVLTASGGLTTQQGNGTVGYVYALTNPQTGLFPAVDNSNSILTVNRHPDNYYSQLGFSSNGNLYYRNFSAVAINTSQAWKTIIDSGNIGSQSVNYATSAGSATTADQIDSIGFRNTNSNDGINANSLDSNGITYVTNVDGSSTNLTGNATDGALYSQIYSSIWQHQIYGDYRTGIMYARGKNNGTWQSWKRVALSSATTFTSVSSLTFTHNLGTSNLTAQVFDSNGDMFFPSNIRITSTQVIVTFASSRSGRLVVTG